MPERDPFARQSRSDHSRSQTSIFMRCLLPRCYAGRGRTGSAKP
jgi:hypothetical protein